MATTLERGRVELTDPRTRFPKAGPPQEQGGTGRESAMQPEPDFGFGPLPGWSFATAAEAAKSAETRASTRIFNRM